MQTTTDTTPAPRAGNHDDPAYDEFLRRMQGRFELVTEDGKAPLFTTDASGLWDLYLSAFGASDRQYHNCNACRHFIERFGGLAFIDHGVPVSALWSMVEPDPSLGRAVELLARAVRHAKITGVFVSDERVLGQPRTGIWTHLSLTLPEPMVHRDRARTAYQAAASKREDYINVSRALADFTPNVLEQALQLLHSDALYRSEKVVGQASWLLHLHHAKRDAMAGSAKDNAVWLAVATAPDGFCHPRSSMIGTLLEDLAAGIPFADVSRKFAAKMNPTLYQRPQAPPAAGNIAAAEKLVQKLGIARSLERRFARLEELQTLWTPPVTARESKGGVFGHLTPKGEATPPNLAVPVQGITWSKFQRTVLPDGKSIELHVPSRGNFSAYVTAEHADAPPILQWDSLEQRNPVSSYVYHGGSNASRWALNPGWTKVTAIAAHPSAWFGGKSVHHDESITFILEGARDTGAAGEGLALFPENLKSELREIRATIEAHSKSGKLGGMAEATACGLRFQGGVPGAVLVRVATAAGVTAEYRIDRWD